ncbi:TniQ family protein [Paraburkholderia bannensis]|uniref:TniQ family protein n=1 Tax=Paraburkholderia bannensis TaxID=765414 RepID=UPI002AB0D241|nr:TniQ family protein [Paraburkholderia bannensis]
MNNRYPSPRSVLHALEPLGVGTPDTESLLSYFYRLAVSHCISALNLLRKVASEMHWNPITDNTFMITNLNLNGSGELAERWSTALSMLSTVPNLDTLTLIPWRNVIAQKTLLSKPFRWCPQCFAQDKAEGREPYFRLLWDIAEVHACPIHRSPLTCICPGCGASNKRNTLGFVVPGWCCSCGVFLGQSEQRLIAEFAEIWKASEIGEMLSSQSNLTSIVCREPMIKGISRLVSELDGGSASAFSRRIGLAKSTLHNWLKADGSPTMAAYLRMSSQTGIALHNLLRGHICDPSTDAGPSLSLTQLFPNITPRRASRYIDRKDINEQLDSLCQLEVPISAREAARRLNLHNRTLYSVSRDKARAISTRWKAQQREAGVKSKERLVAKMKNALIELHRQGRSTSFREMNNHIYSETGETIKKEYDLFKKIRSECGLV